MIRDLLDQGQDVYLIDWGYADRMDRHLTMDDLINGFMDDCIDHICAQHQLEAINLLGVCQGGTFSAIYASLHPEKVKKMEPNNPKFLCQKIPPHCLLAHHKRSEIHQTKSRAHK